MFLALIISTGTLLTFNFILVDKGLRSLYLEMRQPGSIGGFFWDDIIKQGADPFTPKDYEAGSHEANQTFRLTIPLIAYALHLNVATLYMLQLLVGLVFLWTVVNIVNRILNDRVLTFYFLTGFTAIYAGANFYINYLGHVDVFPFCFMAFALYYRNPLLILLFSQLSFWCDERAIINSSFIGLWFLIPFVDQLQTTGKWNWKLISPTILILIFSGVLYLALRKWLELSFNLKIGHDNALSVKSFFWSLSIFGDKVTRGLEGMWLIIGAACLILWQARQLWKLFLFAGALSVTLLIALLVADGTRALSFGFIAFFIALKILHESIPSKQLKYLLIVSALVSLMLPISFP
ncbi:hypothetical protein DVG78_09795 [Runella aurantiaca]|uniref:Glycosyltransferase RgtA/B/C/D-like domain-containing protein n=1 Tax=Runella aurantiaca TaxID=2282308 RepID=A0A369I8N8_9BACT|nr:hypothetical protein DVG78_09795 [Runella aurantiaca]